MVRFGRGRRLVGILALVVGMAAAVLVGVPVAASAAAEPPGSVRIVRDEFGVPHVYAATPRGLFFGDGYATAEDRLWQADLVRRTATGTLSELLGAGNAGQNVASDRYFRGYTGGQARLQAAFTGMSGPDRAALASYVAGINAWIGGGTQAGVLPVEYAAVHRAPRPWTVTDVVASGMLLVLQVGGQGFDELHNAQVLQDMTARLGPVEASKAFTDAHWLDDPAALTTIPSSPLRSSGRAAARSAQSEPRTAAPLPSAAVRERVKRLGDAATAAMNRLGLGGVGHSNAIAVSGRLAASGFPLLLGGPQIGHSVPQGFMEIGLNGGGYDVLGVALAGTPGVQIGVAHGHAWSVTSGGDDNQDAYLDRLDPSGHPGQYLFNGTWRPFDCRLETIPVAGAAAVSTTACQDVHGPVLDLTGGTATVLRDATRERPAASLHAFLALDRARNLPEFVAAGRGLAGSFNLIYADHARHIAYAHVGPVPIRPVTDSRFLPHPGDGTDEWLGVLPPDRMPLVVDPAQGWLANWNNKPVSGWQNSSDGFWQWGPVHRAQVLVDQLRRIRPHTATIATLEKINRTAGQTTESPVADEGSVIVQRLLPALRTHLQLSADPRLAAVAAVLARWNHQRVDVDGDGRYDNPAVTIFNAWYAAFTSRTLVPVLGPDYQPGHLDENVASNLALRLLQGRHAAVPLTANYLRGAPINTAVTDSLVAALDHLTELFHTRDIRAWLTPAATTQWTPLGAGTVPATPFMNRGTYNQIVSLGPQVRGENVLPPGQSGDPRSPHFADQLRLYATWHYKTMHLTDCDVRTHTSAVEWVPVTDTTRRMNTRLPHVGINPKAFSGSASATTREEAPSGHLGCA